MPGAGVIEDLKRAVALATVARGYCYTQVAMRSTSAQVCPLLLLHRLSSNC